VEPAHRRVIREAKAEVEPWRHGSRLIGRGQRHVHARPVAQEQDVAAPGEVGIPNQRR